MKTVFIGDIHGRDVWKNIIEVEKPNRVVFIGDYFDSFDISPAEQQYNFKEIIEFKEKGECEVIMLVGNHDFHYYPGGEQYSGYQHGAAPANRQLLEENKHHLQMCYLMDNILCSHAGIGYDWLVTQNGYGNEPIDEFVNHIWQYRPNSFMFFGLDPTGDSKTQTPIWIRPLSLLRGNRDTFLKEKYIQIVGHTQVNMIDIKGKATGGNYYFIDALGIGEYLIHEDGEFKLGKFNIEIKKMITEFLDNQTRLSYDYRVIAHEYIKGYVFSIHTVYYDEDHNPISYSVNPVWVEREDMEEIHTLLDRMRDATLKPILSADNFPDEFDIEE